jgi:hypothetical protein
MGYLKHQWISERKTKTKRERAHKDSHKLSISILQLRAFLHPSIPEIWPSFKMPAADQWYCIPAPSFSNRLPTNASPPLSSHASSLIIPASYDGCAVVIPGCQRFPASAIRPSASTACAAGFRELGRKNALYLVPG